MAQVKGTDGSGSSSPSKKGIAGVQSPREAAQKIQDYDNSHSGNRGVAGDQSPREAAQKIQDYDNSNSRSNSGGNGGSSKGGSSSGGSSKGGSSSGSSKSSAKTEIKSASIPRTSVGSGITSVAVASSIGASVSAPKLTKVTTSNLTAQNMKNWKARVDRTLSRDLLTSLKISYENANQLDKATSSAEDSDLNLRFKELTRAMEGAVRQLATFVKAFDTNLNEYISTLEKAEKTTSDKMKKSINSFSDAANKINKLKM